MTLNDLEALLYFTSPVRCILSSSLFSLSLKALNLTNSLTHTHTYTHNCLTTLLTRTIRVGWYQNKHAHIVIFTHSLSTFSTYCDPFRPPCSIYVLDSLFPQPVFRSSLVCLLVWNLVLHTPYISSCSHYLL